MTEEANSSGETYNIHPINQGTNNDEKEEEYESSCGDKSLESSKTNLGKATMEHLITIWPKTMKKLNMVSHGNYALDKLDQTQPSGFEITPGPDRAKIQCTA